MINQVPILALLFLVFFVVVISSAPPGFVYTSGTRFEIDSTPFYFAGANCYNLFTFGGGWGDPETQYMNKTEIDNHMALMASYGVKVVRLWAFSLQDWHGFEPSLGKYNTPEFLLFDYVALSAKNHNIKLIVTLENYWADYGGIPGRLQWFNVNAQPNQGIFFTTENAIQSYLDYVKYFITRSNHYNNISYINDPTIFSWELMNEPRYQGFGDDLPSKTLRAWVDRVGKFIRSIDPNHMISAGIEGHGAKYNFGGNEGNDFIVIHSSPYIDFCTAHPYPTEGWANLNISQTETLISAWISDSHNVVKKPFVMEEFNVEESQASGSRSDWWKAMFQVIEQKDGAGDLFWWFQDQPIDGKYGVSGGAPELEVFRSHANVMAQKNKNT